MPFGLTKITHIDRSVLVVKCSELPDAAGEEPLLLIIDEGDCVDVGNLAVKDIGLGPLDELAAEVHPIEDFLVVRRPLVLAKLDSLVTPIGLRIDLVVATDHQVGHIACGVAAAEIIADETLRIIGIILTAGGGHKAVNEFLQPLVVLVDVDNLLTAILTHAHMHMETAGGVDGRACGIEALAALLKALEPVGGVLKDRGHALNGGVAVNRTIGDELVIGSVVGVVVSLIGEIKSGGGASLYPVAADIAFNLDTEGEGHTGEKTGELKILYIAGAEAELDAHRLLFGEGFAALLDGGQGVVQSGHNTLFIYRPFTIGWPVTLIR